MQIHLFRPRSSSLATSPETVAFSTMVSIKFELYGYAVVHGSFPPAILQPHRQIKYRPPRRMIHPVRHKIPMPFKLKLVIGLGLNRAAAGELGPDVSGPHQ